MARYAAGKVELPDEETPSVRDRRKLTQTLSGIGANCPVRDSCQLDFLKALNERDEQWEARLHGIEQQVSEVRSILMQWVGAKGLRSGDSTPAGQRGALDISAGPVKFRGKAWVIALVLLTLGAMAAGAYVLAEWGRPTAVPAKQT
jgi:hypothetical protein